MSATLKKLIKDGIKNREYFAMSVHNGDKWVTDGTWAIRITDESTLPEEVRLAGVGSWRNCKLTELTDDARHDAPNIGKSIPDLKSLVPIKWMTIKENTRLMFASNGSGHGDIYVLDAEEDTGLRRLPVDSIEEFCGYGEWMAQNQPGTCYSFVVNDEIVAVLMPIRI